jgi:ribosomal protein S18 acetylase RimI-like enzyme
MIISVKEAVMTNAELISRMATETFYETYSWYNTTEDMRDYTGKYFNIKQTEKEIAEKGTFFFLAYGDEEIIGYVKLRSSENPEELKGKTHIEIERIYVKQNFQKHKVGYALINKCFEFARQKNLDTIWLGVWEKNQRAIAFYERVGFKIFGNHIFTLGKDPQNDYLMKFELKN